MATVKVTTEIELDVKIAARWFASLDDNEMCRFLVEVAEEVKQFDGSAENQWYYLGGHLRNCACSTDEAREMVRKWAYWAEHSDYQ